MKYLFGNWKLNLSRSSAIALAKEINRGVLTSGTIKSSIRTCVFPTTCWLDCVCEELRGGAVEVGVQNCYSAQTGQFTGETSATMVKELGAAWVLIGHSERRRTFGESNAEVAARCSGCIEAGLNPVICVGENVAELKDGLTEKIVLEQLRPCLTTLRSDSKPVIAYEPVWSIGSGNVPTHEQILSVAKTIQNETGCKIPVLYGGSVTPDNASQLMQIPGIEGFLVGGSSLDADKFLRIAHDLAKTF